MKLIVGVGNRYRRDEGVGPAVVDRLTEGKTLAPGIQAVDAGTPGVGLLEIARGADRMVVVDAMRTGGAPGTIHVVEPGRLRSLGQEAELSLHGVSMLGVIRLAEALGERLPEIAIVGVEVEDVGWGEGLSPGVDLAVDPAAVIALQVAQADGSMVRSIPR